MAPWFLTLLLYAAVYVAIDIIRPKPKLEDARPAGLGDFSFPTATEGRVVPLIWGQVELKAPNVVWYGNFRQGARTKSVKTGLFSSDDVTIGFRYYFGIQFALCRGPVDKLIAIKAQERTIALGRTGSGSAPISAPSCFGGEEFGSGGVDGSGNFYAGGTAESRDSYLQSQCDTNVTAYRGTCYYVFNGYVGTSTSIPPFAFVIERIPDGLNLAAYDPGSERINSYDANPMNVIYEIMTNTEWGLGIPSSSIDVPNFQAAGSILSDEGNGFSMVLDSETEAIDLLQELQRQIDGMIYFNKPTGQWQIALAREDYDPGTLTVFDESNVLEVSHFARATWEETCNQVNIKFADRSAEYRDTYAMAQDMANYQIQGATIASEITYPGVKNKALANKLAWRDLRTLSYPLAKCELILNREAYNLIPTSPFKWSCARLGITEMIMRVIRVDYGQLDQGRIRVNAVQDIFAVTAGTFADPPATSWTDPVDDPGVLTLDDILSFEAPYQLINEDPWRPDMTMRIWSGARNPGGGTTMLQPYWRSGTSRPLTADFTEDDQGIWAFALVGSLKTDLPAYHATAARPASAYVYLNNNDPDDLEDLIDSRGNYVDVQELRTLLYIDGEFIGYEKLYGPTSNLRAYNLYRGLFHTAPKAHAAGVPVWLIGQSGGNLSGFTLPAGDDEVDLKLYGKNRRGIFTSTEPPIVELSIQNIAKVPLAPRDPELNTVYAPSSISLDTNHAGAGGSGDNNRSIQVEFVPRYWAVTNVLMDEVTSYLESAWLADSPEFDVVLVLDVGGGDYTTEVHTIVPTDYTPLGYVMRNAVIVAVGANTQIPGTGQLQVTARHTVDAVTYTNPVKMTLDLTITSALQGQELIFGGFAATVDSASVVFGETGNYAFDIHYALPSSGVLQASINGGAYATVVSAGATTGNLSVTTGDSVRLKFTVAPSGDQYFDITGPVSETGYGVLLS